MPYMLNFRQIARARRRMIWKRIIQSAQRQVPHAAVMVHIGTAY
jgi:hypothetical protein